VWENHLPRATVLAAHMSSRLRTHPAHYKTKQEDRGAVNLS